MKKQSKKLFICLLFLGYSPLLAVEAESLMSSLFMTISCHPRTYNSLPTVEEAHSLLQENGNLMDFLKEARTIALDYKLEHSLGLRLIHRHFALEENENMVESYGDMNTKKELITKPE